MKVTFKFGLLGLLFLLSSCIFTDGRPKHVKIAENLRDKISKELQQRFHMRQVGSGGGMHETVNLICLAFDFTKSTMTQDEARALIIPMTQLFLQRINENEEIRPYLKNYPFEVENIEISIGIYDNEGRMLVDPFIGIVSCSVGCVGFSTYCPEKSHITKISFTETYLEAVEKYNAQERAKNLNSANRY